LQTDNLGGTKEWRKMKRENSY